MTALRSIDGDFDPEVIANIDAQLDQVEIDHGVRILLAVESGSRGWGFPSPDSDYDCRFVYARPRESYLSLFKQRDVIEYPPDAIYDVNGWDLAKSLKLLLKGNAVIVEWLTSPQIYRGNAVFRDGFLTLARRIAPRETILRHYLHLGRRHYASRIQGQDQVPLKKLFYALRPALALRWMAGHPEENLPPMNIHALCNGAGLEVELMEEIETLLALKAKTRELGDGPMPPAIGELLHDAFVATDPPAGLKPATQDISLQEADRFFRKWIGKA